MKLIFLILLLCGASSSFAQNDSLVFTQFKHKNGTVSSEGYLRKGKPDGYWKTYNEEGVLVSEGNRKNYLLDSVWTFYSKGLRHAQISYRKGKKYGLSKSFGENEYIETEYVNDLPSGERRIYYYPDSTLKQRTPYTAGLEHGMEFDYSPDGTVVGITEYRKGFIVSRQRINRRDKQGLRQGLWKFFYPSWVVECEGTYLNDKKHGYFKCFDTLGKLLTVEKYIDGELETQTQNVDRVEVKTEYFPNGKPRLSVGYKNGVPEGVAREYDTAGKVVKGIVFSNGKVSASGIVDDRGRFQDNWKLFYDDGKVKAEGRYRNGKRVGSWQYYFPSGAVEQKGSFNKNGEYEGEWSWYYENGETHIIQNYLNGLLDGDFSEYNETGNLIAKGQYIEGDRHGAWTIRSGDEVSEGKYKNGEMHGKWRTSAAHDKKKISFEGAYMEGIPHGRHVYYQDNGKILEEGSYSMGKRIGIWKKYDEKGQLYISISYKNDEEVRYDHIRVDAHIKDQ